MRFVCCAVVLLLLSASGVARAQDLGLPGQPSAAEKAQAARLFEEALAAYDRGEIASAIESLRTANAIAPSPQVLYNLAQFEAAAHQDAEAFADFERYLRSADPTLSPAREQAVRHKQEELRKRLAELRIRIEPPSAAVSIDGRSVALDSLLAPGTHRVLAQAEGFVASELELEARAGETLHVVVRLVPTVPPAPPPVADAPSPVARATSLPAPRAVAPAPASRAWPRGRTWAAVLVGAGVALAAGAAVAYAVSSNEADTWSSESSRLDATEPAVRDDAYWQDRARNVQRSRKVRELEGLELGLLLGAATVTTAGVAIWLTSPTATEPARAAGLSYRTSF